MAKNRLFFPQAALDQWVVDGKVELTNDELMLKSEGRRYRIAEAAHVMREVSGQPDPYEICGRVKSFNFLRELGAEMLDESMIIGDNAYDVVPGFMGSPIGSLQEHLASPGAGAAAPTAKTEEDLLSQLLLKEL